MYIYRILLVLVCVSPWFCQGENEESTSSELAEFFSEDRFFQQVVDGNNRLGFEFYRSIKNQLGNLCFSPFCMTGSLGLAAAGAKGDTAHEFQKVLGFSQNLLPLIGDLTVQFADGTQTGSQVLVANALWVQKGLPLAASYKLSIQRGLQSGLESVDFAKDLAQSVQTINKWVSQKTKGKIIQLLSPQDVTTQTRLVLTSAVYMKGAWAQPFDLGQTKRLPFQVSTKKSLSTMMMHQTTKFALLKGEKWDMLEIPYRIGDEGRGLVFTILLPKNHSLEELEESLTWENWKQWLNQVEMQPVSLTMPRFRIEKRFDLKTAFQSLGIGLAFSEEADFSGMTGKKELFLNKAIQKMFVVIDEAGTEAAAASGSSFERKSAVEVVESPFEFKADHPFLFIIRDRKTSVILYMGRLSIP